MRAEHLAIYEHRERPRDVPRDLSHRHAGMQLDLARTALVFIDPQTESLNALQDVSAILALSDGGRLIPNLGRLFVAAKLAGIVIAISPHRWHSGGARRKFMRALKMLRHWLGKLGRRTVEEFTGSGTAFMPELRFYIDDGKTLIVSPHTMHRPKLNDLIHQLQRQGVEQVVLAGISATLCVDSHLRQLLNAGFEVAVVCDATAGPEVHGAEIHGAGAIHAFWTTEETISRLAVPI